MKAHVDKNTCIGCGLCAATCPMVFSMDGDEKAVAVDEDIHSGMIDLANEAMDGCPVMAITIK